MKFEYLTLQSFVHSRPGYFTLIRSNAVESVTAQNITDAMTALGKEGWELVSSENTATEGSLLFFKRAL